MPSLVGFADDGSVVMGERAQTLPPGQLVRSIKRAITEHRDFETVDLPGGTKDVRADDLIVELLKEAGRRGAGGARTSASAAWCGSGARRCGTAGNGGACWRRPNGRTCRWCWRRWWTNRWRPASRGSRTTRARLTVHCG
jgi:hypothetical protein